MVASASRGKQHGLALLLLLLILIGMTGALFLVNTMNKSSAALSVARDQKTQAALDLAKHALLSYVVTVLAENAMSSTSHGPSKGVPGYFPCPEMSPPVLLPEGSAAGNCGSSGVSAIGRLPWYTLGLEPLRDASGECLWYAVSGTYKFNPNGANIDPGMSSTSNMMNWDTPGLFNVLASDGSTFLAGGSGPSAASARAVAVIFAPGAPLPGQNRPSAGGASCRGDYAASNYLEIANGVNNSVMSGSVNGITQFIAGWASLGPTPSAFNDRLVYITRDEVWAAIKKLPDPSGGYPSLLQAKFDTLTRKVAKCIAKYGTRNDNGLADKRLPWATPALLSPMSEYAFDRRYNDTNDQMSGRVSSRVNTSTSATDNDISEYLFDTASYCFTITGAGDTMDHRDLNWYYNWKDHFFYALSWEFRPSNTDTSTDPCTGGNCVKVNGGIGRAAVVMFAGERLAALNQVRATDADRADISNYLENANATNYHDSNGNRNYQSGPATTTFNDLLYCIRWDVTTAELCP